jgi:TetR/AcrR family tetracycline transcriptional repressor
VLEGDASPKLHGRMAYRADVKLDVAQIIDAAFRRMEDVGLDRLSMRGISTLLGVHGQGFYYYLSGKAEIQRLMVAQIYSLAASRAPATASWADWLKTFGHTLRESLSQYRDGAKLCALTPIDLQDSMGPLAARYVSTGIREADVFRGLAAVIAFSIGWGLVDAGIPAPEGRKSSGAFACALDALVGAM